MPLAVVAEHEDGDGGLLRGRQFVTLARSIGVCLFYGAVSVLISLVNKARGARPVAAGLARRGGSTEGAPGVPARRPS